MKAARVWGDHQETACAPQVKGYKEPPGMKSQLGTCARATQLQAERRHDPVNRGADREPLLKLPNAFRNQEKSFRRVTGFHCRTLRANGRMLLSR